MNVADVHSCVALIFCCSERPNITELLEAADNRKCSPSLPTQKIDLCQVHQHFLNLIPVAEQCMSNAR